MQLWSFQLHIANAGSKGHPAQAEVKQAERDLVNAGKNIGIDVFELAAFVAEQAVEKCLKAAWVRFTIETRPRLRSKSRQPKRSSSGSDN
ncbi:MAG: HEPN domain-containing protein [Gemmatimonadetes bacterium]|nr:HEPN domain-containing protein [Gemmatimonadota bacterium]